MGNLIDALFLSIVLPIVIVFEVLGTVLTLTFGATIEALTNIIPHN